MLKDSVTEIKSEFLFCKRSFQIGGRCGHHMFLFCCICRMSNNVVLVLLWANKNLNL